MRYITGLGVIFVMALLIFGYEHFDIDGWKGSKTLEKQLNESILKHDTQMFKEIAEDDASYNFLSSLPKSIHCERTSGAQGGDQANTYYATVLNHRKVEVWMKRKSNFWLGNQYSLSRIRVTDEVVE